MGKILLFLSMALSLATVVLGFVNKNQYVQRGETISSQEQTIAQKEQALKTEQENLKAAQADLEKTAAEKEAAISQAQSAKAEAEQFKTKASDLENQIKTKEDEISKLTADIKAKEAELTTLREAQTAASTDPSTDVAAQLAEKETLISKLQNDLESARQQVADLRKREADRQALRMRDGLQGRILAVNQAWNFVVLNLGDKNGVVSNAEMLVKRGNSLIGKVRITSVEPATSIADIIPSSVPAGVMISPGDQVIFQASAE